MRKTADETRVSALSRRGLLATGVAAFAAGYGETLAKGAKGLITGTSGVATASATICGRRERSTMVGRQGRVGASRRHGC